MEPVQRSRYSPPHAHIPSARARQVGPPAVVSADAPAVLVTERGLERPTVVHSVGWPAFRRRNAVLNWGVGEPEAEGPLGANSPHGAHGVHRIGDRHIHI